MKTVDEGLECATGLMNTLSLWIVALGSKTKIKCFPSIGVTDFVRFKYEPTCKANDFILNHEFVCLMPVTAHLVQSCGQPIAQEAQGIGQCFSIRSLGSVGQSTFLPYQEVGGSGNVDHLGASGWETLAQVKATRWMGCQTSTGHALALWSKRHHFPQEKQRENEKS